MSRVTAGDVNTHPRVGSNGQFVRLVTNIHYSRFRPVNGFKGLNFIPPVDVVMEIQRGLVFPEPSGRIILTFFDGFQVELTFYRGPRPLDLLSPDIGPNNRPNRIRQLRGASFSGRDLLIIEKDVTVNINREIVTYDPSRITDTLVYSFEVGYSVVRDFDYLDLNPVVLGDVTNINYVSGIVTYIVPIRG